MEVVALELTRVDLTPEDASLFWEFQKHRETFKTLVKAGVFNLRNKAFTCHVDGTGTIRRIDTIQILFSS